jgi:hypothetical protein
MSTLDEIEDPIEFDDQASNGTPRMKMDKVKEEYPKLFAKIMENFTLGKPFQAGEFSYKVQTSDQYGNTVYKNKAGKGKTTGATGGNAELTNAIKQLTNTITEQNNLLRGKQWPLGT